MLEKSEAFEFKTFAAGRVSWSAKCHGLAPGCVGHVFTINSTFHSSSYIILDSIKSRMEQRNSRITEQ